MGTTIVSFVIVLGVLIFAHELGHFMVARLCGVGVEKFSLGFGPRLFGKTVGETDYCVSAIPLGGYVKMVGENIDEEDVDPAKIPISFHHKPVFQRFSIVAAGPFSNVLLAVLIYFIFFVFIGSKDLVPIVKHVDADSPAQHVGMLPGDRVMAVDGQPVTAWSDLLEQVEKSQGRSLSLTVQRDQRQLVFDMKPRPVNRTDIFGDEQTVYDLGISAFPPIEAAVGGVSTGTPAQKAGLQPGDRIMAVDGQPVHDWEQMREQIATSGGKLLSLAIQRGQEHLSVELTPTKFSEKTISGETVERYVIGITAPRFEIPENERIQRRLGPVRGLAESLHQTWWVTETTVVGIYKMISGSISSKFIAGPITIAQMAGDQARQGIGHLLQFIAFISINLAILNILPVPVLDGGHLLFFAIEALRGKPVSIRVREVAQQAGLFVLLLLMVFAMYNDINRLLPN